MTSTPPTDTPSSAPGTPEREGVPLTPDARESLIEYPSAFPIKIVGVNENGFVHAITHIAKQFDPAFDAAGIELRESGGGKYLGITITVTATSREQLDELYRALSTHPMAKWVL
ncbi:YbeD family protein [Ottowia sp. VDI28]|uniref:YbeD family protein n=1 Tax=Ottowia sp. VDI28 TaxID=3133968 RepID=UPI003C30CB6E